MSGADPARPELLLLDTHTLIWLTFSDPRLGKRAHSSIQIASQENRLAISAITPWEVALLVSKKKIDLFRDVMVWVNETLALPGSTLVGLEPEIAVASTRLPFEMHPDPADRILVATARQLGATLVTSDRALLELAVKGYFRACNAGD